MRRCARVCVSLVRLSRDGKLCAAATLGRWFERTFRSSAAPRPSLHQSDVLFEYVAAPRVEPVRCRTSRARALSPSCACAVFLREDAADFRAPRLGNENPTGRERWQARTPRRGHRLPQKRAGARVRVAAEAPSARHVQRALRLRLPLSPSSFAPRPYGEIKAPRKMMRSTTTRRLTMAGHVRAVASRLRSSGSSPRSVCLATRTLGDESRLALYSPSVHGRGT